jgi:L-alanine-DL-glutamate epimerase-like enolase superfamily enzyme
LVMSKIKNIYYNKTVRPMMTTFATSLGRKNCATSVIVKIELAYGSVGVGEIPTSFVLKHETVEAIEGIVEDVKGRLKNSRIQDYKSHVKELKLRWPQYHMTVSGVEMALFRAWLENSGKSEMEYWGAKNYKIETDITIPFVPDYDYLEPWLKFAARKQFSVYKIKTSGHVDRDIKFVSNIHNFLSDNVKAFKIRLDGNQGYNSKTCLEMLAKLRKADIDIELFEQPLAKDDFRGMKHVFKNAPVPIIADETVFSEQDCIKVIENQLAHGVNIKIAKSGIDESVKILKLAKKAGLKCMIGCMTETMIGLSASIFMAAGTNSFDYIDLDSIYFLYHKNHLGNISIGDNTYEILRED